MPEASSIGVRLRVASLVLYAVMVGVGRPSTSLLRQAKRFARCSIGVESLISVCTYGNPEAQTNLISALPANVIGSRLADNGLGDLTFGDRAHVAPVACITSMEPE